MLWASVVKGRREAPIRAREGMVRCIMIVCKAFSDATDRSRTLATDKKRVGRLLKTLDL